MRDGGGNKQHYRKWSGDNLRVIMILLYWKWVRGGGEKMERLEDIRGLDLYKANLAAGFLRIMIA